MTALTDQIVQLLQQGKVDEAQQRLDAAPPGEMEPSARTLCTGEILERQGEWSKAAETYQSVLDEKPDDSEATFRLAYLADLRGDDEAAMELYEQLTAETPAHVNALLNLSVLYEDCGEYNDALTCLERVMEELPDHKRANLFYRDIVASLDMYYDEDRERTAEKRNAILETPISDFELSIRSHNCLKQMDIHTLGNLLQTTASDLLSYKNFGETSLHEIETMLAQKGLRLGQLLDEKEPDMTRLMAPPGADPAKVNVLNRSVAELELSVRARKCLMRLGLSTIGELMARSEADLLSIKNFGMTSLAEIKRRLAELGLALPAN